MYARAVASATDNEVLDETLVEKALRPVATLRADLRSGKKRAEGPSSPEDISRLSGKPLPEVDRTRATDGARSSRWPSGLSASATAALARRSRRTSSNHSPRHWRVRRQEEARCGRAYWALGGAGTRTGEPRSEGSVRGGPRRVDRRDRHPGSEPLIPGSRSIQRMANGTVAIRHTRARVWRSSTLREFEGPRGTSCSARKRQRLPSMGARETRGNRAPSPPRARAYFSVAGTGGNQRRAFARMTPSLMTTTTIAGTRKTRYPARESSAATKPPTANAAIFPPRRSAPRTA
jgi:hypothetical protein